MIQLVPCSLAQAKEFVAQFHRHHKPPAGHKFSIGVARAGELVGVAMVGRPVARHYDDGRTLEVNRTCVIEGVPNANSMLYGACRRAAQALGYARLITYTQEGESGASLRAAGWRMAATRKPRAGWSAGSRERDDKSPTQLTRFLWEAW